jgi:hypothetical protein
MSVTFTDTSLIKKIIRLLDEIKHEVNHPELEIILKRLNALMTGMPESPVKSERKHVRKEKTRSLDIEDKLPEAPSRSYVNDEMISYSKLRYEILSWEDVYRSCNIFPDRVIPHS